MGEWKNDIGLPDIIDEIKTGQCVLVIGQDIIDHPGNISHFKYLVQKFRDENPASDLPKAGSYIFENEELLHLPPGTRESGIYRFLRNYYAQRREFDIPFEKIALIPFHLIISLFPDKRLPDLFNDLGIDAHFSYFPRTKGQEDVPVISENPSCEKPLIYNLMGVLDPPDAVLTFDNYFEYLMSFLPDNALPVKLQNTLNNAKSFIFLGVRFEKWNIQLLLRKISPYPKNKNQLKLSLIRNSDDSDTSTFIAKRLELDFFSESPEDFLNELYKRCLKGNLLREIKRKFIRKVFISYNHKDSVVADLILPYLDQHDIEVIRDVKDLPYGRKISEFTSLVKTVDAVIFISTQNSLQSAWVAKELQIAIKNCRPILPYDLDEYISNSNYVTETMFLVDNRLRDINSRIAKRLEDYPGEKYDDLSQERDLWADFNGNIQDIAKFLQDTKRINHRNADQADSLDQLLNAIKG